MASVFCRFVRSGGLIRKGIQVERRCSFSMTSVKLDFDSGDYGPRDPAMWCSGPVGFWRDNLYRYFPQGMMDTPPRYPTHAHIFTMKVKDEIDLDKFQEAIRACIYNYPELRVRVDMNEDPAVQLPVKDFSGIFEFKDLRDMEEPEYRYMVEMSQKEYVKGWDMDSEKGLVRWVLVRTRERYYLIGLMHHGAHDALSSIYTTENIFKQYDRLMSGTPCLIDPVEPVALLEDMVTHHDEKAVDELIDLRLKHFMEYSCYVNPSNVEEYEDNLHNGRIVLDMDSYFGTIEEAERIKDTCRSLGVTVGAMSFAASLMAVAVQYIKKPDSKFLTDGMHERIFFSVSCRPYVDLPDFNRRPGFFVKNLLLFQEVDKDTTLFKLAKDCNVEIRERLARKEHLLHDQLKDRLNEMGGEIRNMRDDGSISIHLSNIGNLDFMANWNWGQLEWMTIGGDVGANPLGLMHGISLSTVKGLCMDWHYYKGENNERNAMALWKAFKAIFLDSGSPEGDLTVQQFIEKHNL